MKGKICGWENALDPEEEEEFRTLQRQMDKLQKIRFPMSIVPKEGQLRKTLLMVFEDGSHEACRSLIYLRLERDDGLVVCRLVTR